MLAHMSKHAALLLVFCFATPLVFASEPELVELRERYTAYQVWKQDRRAHVSLFLQTDENDGLFKARMGVELGYTTLEELTPALGSPRAWCEFMLLHLRVEPSCGSMRPKNTTGSCTS